MTRRADRLRREATARENARLKRWLQNIVVRCRGMAPGLASQALNTERWPESWARGKR